MGWQGALRQLMWTRRRQKEVGSQAGGGAGDLDERAAVENKDAGRADQGRGQATLLLSYLRFGCLFKVLRHFSQVQALLYQSSKFFSFRA